MGAAAAQVLKDAPGRALDVFQLRSEATAILVAHRQMSLHEGTDRLWEAAQAAGLVRDIGVDAVQAIMAEAFEPWAEFWRC